MKKHLLLFTIIFCSHNAFSQDTPGNPGNPPPWMLCLEFNTQSQVDSFPINFPDISSVLCLKIFGSDITNVDSLIAIDSIAGNLVIGSGFLDDLSGPLMGNPLLENINGLSNLNYIGGLILIYENDNLESLSALGGVSSCDFLWITGNDGLTNLDGLENLTTINGWLGISSNDLLTDLSALQNVSSVGHNLTIEDNESLESLYGLEGINSIGMHLGIFNNPILSDINALENIDPFSIVTLTINDNPSLSNCSIESICSYIAIDESEVNIANNQQGCNTEAEIESSCNLCPENIFYTEQWQIDSFPIWYPNCENIVGDVMLNYSSATNIDSLYSIKSIAGNFIIQSSQFQNLDGLSQLESAYRIQLITNFSLENIDGLSNLQSLEYLVFWGNSIESISAFSNIESLVQLSIKEDGLQSLTGLENISGHVEGLQINGNEYINNYTGLGPITSIGHLNGGDDMENFTGLESLNKIGTFDIYDNDYESLIGLENVDSLTGDLWISGDPSLLSLEPLNGILINDTTNIHIYDNPELSVCDVDFICERIVSMPESLEIYSNSEGCNDLMEIEEACEIGVGIDEIVNGKVSIYPNPAKDILYINSEAKIKSIHLINAVGQEMPLLNEKAIDVSQLPRGLYILELEIENEIIRKRVLLSN